MIKKEAVTIIGAGPVGLLLAILLAKRGYHIDLYERFSEEELCQHASTRSFSITFFKRGLDILQRAGLLDDFSPHLLPITGSVIHPLFDDEIVLDANTTRTPYHVIKRSTIVEIMMREIAQYPHITLHFNKSVVSVDRYRNTMFIEDTKNGKHEIIPISVVFGADGAHSQIRKFVYEGQNAEFTEEYEQWKYKQIFFPADVVKKMNLQQDRMHLWPREKAMLLIFPNAEGSMTGMLVLSSFEQFQTREDVKAFISKKFEALLPNLGQITNNILKNPVGKFVSIHVNPWYYKGKMALLGDAAHASLPSHGQGITAGFEDVWSLIELLDTYGPAWDRIFPEYQEKRKKHADALVDVSKSSFIRFMRHKKADYEAVYDRVDELLYKFFPWFWQPPFYVLMSSYTKGFADIAAIHKKQRRIGKYLGISLAVWIFTKILSFIETITSSHS